MIYLSGAKNDAIADDLATGRVGLLNTPKSAYVLDGVAVWAMDNGCYTDTYPGDDAYMATLDRYAALASINLLLASPWQEQVQHIEDQLKQLLAPTLAYDHVADVRVLGGIGVIETQRPVKMQEITAAFVNAGIWVRPFGKLVYLMPPFVIEDADLTLLANGLVKVLADESLLMN